MKKSHQAEGILKKDCQAFVTMIGKASTLNEAFQYPVTSVPLSIATLDRDLLQSEEASLRYFLFSNSNATTKCMTENVSWLIDSLAAVQSLKFKNKYGEWFESLTRFITQPKVAECLLVDTVNDAYQELNTKNNT